MSANLNDSEKNFLAFLEKLALDDTIFNQFSQFMQDPSMNDQLKTFLTNQGLGSDIITILLNRDVQGLRTYTKTLNQKASIKPSVVVFFFP